MRASTLFSSGTTSTATGGPQIGDVQFFHNAGVLINKPNGEVWLRSGTIALKTLYPNSAGVEHLMVHGGANITLPTPVSVSGFAHNGAGRGIVAFGSITQVLLTTDYGATWILVDHNGGVAISDVCWTGTRFLAVGNSNDYLRVTGSTNGSTFSFVSGISISNATRTGSARIATDGTRSVICVGDNSAVWTIIDGGGVVRQTSGLSTMGPAPRIAVLPSLGETRWLVIPGNAPSLYQSTLANATTWVTRTTPNSFSTLTAGNGVLVGFGNGTLYKSTSGLNTSWETVSYPNTIYSSSSFGELEVGYPASITFDGTYFLIGAYNASTGVRGLFGYTTNFSVIQLRQMTVQPTTSYASYTALSFGDHLAFLNAHPSGPSTLASQGLNWKTSSEYIGIINPMMIAPTSNSAQTRAIVGYIRVK